MNTGKSPQWGKQRFVVDRADRGRFYIDANGRARWALEALIAAGSKGCTPIETPGPRWSHYVFILRGMGVDIATVTEPHGPPFEGTHARYVLNSKVTKVLNEAAA